MASASCNLLILCAATAGNDAGGVHDRCLVPSFRLNDKVSLILNDIVHAVPWTQTTINKTNTDKISHSLRHMALRYDTTSDQTAISRKRFSICAENFTETYSRSLYWWSSSYIALSRRSLDRIKLLYEPTSAKWPA